MSKVPHKDFLFGFPDKIIRLQVYQELRKIVGEIFGHF